MPKKREYLDVLGVLYALMRELRSKPRNEVEAHFDDPTQSPIFQRFPSVIKNDELLTFICDYCRLIIIGNARTHEIELLMDEEIQTVKHDKLKAYHSMVTISEAFPALGIVAAVLGVIKAMGALDQAPEVLGHLIGAALVGTFAGIFFSYAVVSPIANNIKVVREKKMRLYVIVKQTLLAFMNGAMPQIALEHGRKTISAYERPTIDEVEQETLAPAVAATPRPHARRRRSRHGGGSARIGAGRDSLAELFAGSSNFSSAADAARGVRPCCGCLHRRAGAAARAAATGDPAGTWRAGRLPTCWARTTARAPSVCCTPRGGTPAVLSADRDAVFAIVEAMLGGDGSHQAQAPDRPLSRPRATSIAAIARRYPTRRARAPAAKFPPMETAMTRKKAEVTRRSRSARAERAARAGSAGAAGART